MLAIITRMTLTQVGVSRILLFLEHLRCQVYLSIIPGVFCFLSVFNLFFSVLSTSWHIFHLFDSMLFSDLHPSPQVSTWFANARRRLKKENKVTWSPRACKSSEDRGCDDDSDEAEKPLKNDKDLPGKQDLNHSVSTFCIIQGFLRV